MVGQTYLIKDEVIQLRLLAVPFPLFNSLSAFLERNHVWSSATYNPLELASRTTCVVRSTCTGTMKKHAAAVSFIAPASTETAVVAGAAGVTKVDGAAAWAWAHV